MIVDCRFLYILYCMLFIFYWLLAVDSSLLFLDYLFFDFFLLVVPIEKNIGDKGYRIVSMPIYIYMALS